MASQVMQIILVGCVGSLFYHLLRALDQKEMAGLLQLVCYALVASNVLQVLLGLWDKINQSPIIKLITKLGGS